MANRYTNIEDLKSNRGTRYKINAIYPEVPPTEDDIYVITAASDRYDTLAQQFYGDSSLWWVIASANVSKTDGLAVKQGVQLRIPADGPGAKVLFEEVNATR
jgi:hypothetical protein|tara:strand:+ start:1008 stop:1313 length:306 start_codon:yes stop_codon:yes gene_type:complete